MLKIRRVSKGAHSRPNLADFFTGAAGFLVVALLATTGIVEGSSGSALAGPGGTYYAEGHIHAGNPSLFFGVTENELAVFCSYPPDSQGVDGYVFELPEDFMLPAPATATGTSTGPHDLNVYFYDVACDFIGDENMANIPGADEEGTIPAGTRYVVVDLFAGAETRAALCVGDPAGCVSGSASPSSSESTSPSTSPSGPPPPEGQQRISIQTDTNLTRFRDRFRLSGIVEGEVECGPPQTHRVGVAKKVVGSSGYKVVDRSIPVAPNGTWSLTLRSTKSAKYFADVAPSVGCARARTGPLLIRVRAKLGPVRVPGKEGCGPVTVRGRLRPLYKGTTVKLQRHAGKRKWKGLSESSRVNKRGKYNLKAPGCGLYRAIWRKQARANAWGFAKFRHRRG